MMTGCITNPSSTPKHSDRLSAFWFSVSFFFFLWFMFSCSLLSSCFYHLLFLTWAPSSFFGMDFLRKESDHKQQWVIGASALSASQSQENNPHGNSSLMQETQKKEKRHPKWQFDRKLCKLHSESTPKHHQFSCTRTALLTVQFLWSIPHVRGHESESFFGSALTAFGQLMKEGNWCRAFFLV